MAPGAGVKDVPLLRSCNDTPCVGNSYPISYCPTMRWLMICFLLLCLGCTTAPTERVRTFQEALSAYDEEDYRQAAALYEQLIEQGMRSGTVYYNLGNAWARADEPVRAIAAYYLAKRYSPNDPHLNANLRTVLMSNGGTPPPSERSLVGSLFFWQHWIGIDTKMHVSLILAALTFLGGVLCVVSRAGGVSPPVRSTIFLAIFTTIALASTGYDWYRFESVERIIVATTEALPRKGNSEHYEPAFLSPIPFGTLAIIQDERSGWYSLRFPDGQEGWLPHSQTFRLQ